MRKIHCIAAQNRLFLKVKKKEVGGLRNFAKSRSPPKIHESATHTCLGYMLMVKCGQVWRWVGGGGGWDSANN